MVNLKKHPSDLLKESWDKEQIAEKLIVSDDIPNFGLDKVEFHISGTCNLKCPFCYGSDFAPNKRVFLKTESICPPGFPFITAPLLRFNSATNDYHPLSFKYDLSLETTKDKFNLQLFEQ